MARAFVNALSKSGTHLAMRCVSLMPGMSRGVPCPEPLPYFSPDHSISDLKATLERIRGGGYFCGHIGFCTEVQTELQICNAKTVIVIRDPRDLAVSTMLWIRGFPQHTLHEAMTLKTPDEGLHLLLEGSPAGGAASYMVPSLASLYERMYCWRNQDNTVVLHFEDLIGRLGGGSPSGQKLALRKLAAHLGIALQEREIAAIVRAVEKSGWNYCRNLNNFMRGQIGLWQAGVISPGMTDRLRQELSKTAALWGYQ